MTKVNANGQSLAWSSYLGGARNDFGTGIAVDGSGNVYVTGETQSTDFPTTGGFATTYGGGYRDAFVTKVNANGQNLVWSSYLGGSDWDEGAGIAVVGSGNAYVTGETQSTDFPTPGGFDTTYGGNGDAFVVRLGLLPNGRTCISASQCLSGNCVDGVCCDNACGGGATTDCQACSVAAGAAVNGACGFVAAGRVCRAASAGPCDAAERCTGTSAACPADGFAPATTVCRPAVGPCDVEERCTGTSAACPADGLAPATTVCRPASGDCDVEERCTGTSAACPADGFAPATKVCRPSAGICDVEDTCTGTSATCPPDAVAPSSTLCRGLSGVCDVQEFCDGVHAECPPDGFAPPTTQCRLPWCNGDTAMKAGYCSGTSVDCPPEETEVCAPGACLGGTCTATRDMGGRAGGCGCAAALPFSSLVPWAFVALVLTARRRRP